MSYDKQMIYNNNNNNSVSLTKSEDIYNFSTEENMIQDLFQAIQGTGKKIVFASVGRHKVDPNPTSFDL